jgi:hypothetical protein
MHSTRHDAVCLGIEVLAIARAVVCWAIMATVRSPIITFRSIATVVAGLAMIT